MVQALGQPSTNAPVLNDAGTFQTVWVQWLTQVYTRLGGSVGVVQVPVYAANALPTAGIRPATLGGGDNTNGQIYISTTSKPAWSDGTAWRYADGTLV